ncbi:MAG: hypothetical protein AAFY71_04440 [Bacteroidota bacterium]
MNYTLSGTIFLIGFFVGVCVYAQTEVPDYFEGALNFSVEFAGPQAEELKMNEPNNKIRMFIKNNNYIVQLSGGRYPKTFIFVADSNYEYSINYSEKKAYRFSMYSDRTKDKKEEAIPTAKPTGKQKEIKGVLCDEYKMVTKNTVFYYYVNDKYRVDIANYPMKPRSKASWLAKGLDGRIPLETIKKQKNLSVKTSLISLKSRSFDPEQFMIPPTFKVKGRDYRY